MGKVTYNKCTASNGVVLHAMKCSPNDIKLQACRTSVCSQPLTAINGGFFNFGTGEILSISVQNDNPIKGRRGAYGAAGTMPSMPGERLYGMR